MAKRVSAALFGDSKPEHLFFKTINAAQRIELLKSGDIDMVARAMTMTCDRWNDVAFSEPYFEATQRVLVRRNAEEKSLAALAAKKKQGLRDQRVDQHPATARRLSRGTGGGRRAHDRLPGPLAAGPRRRDHR